MVTFFESNYHELVGKMQYVPNMLYMHHACCQMPMQAANRMKQTPVNHM